MVNIYKSVIVFTFWFINLQKINKIIDNRKFT